MVYSGREKKAVLGTWSQLPGVGGYLRLGRILPKYTGVVSRMIISRSWQEAFLFFI
jgi:hypothetical protein